MEEKLNFKELIEKYKNVKDAINLEDIEKDNKSLLADIEDKNKKIVNVDYSIRQNRNRLNRIKRTLQKDPEFTEKPETLLAETEQKLNEAKKYKDQLKQKIKEDEKRLEANKRKLEEPEKVYNEVVAEAETKTNTINNNIKKKISELEEERKSYGILTKDKDGKPIRRITPEERIVIENITENINKLNKQISINNDKLKKFKALIEQMKGTNKTVNNEEKLSGEGIKSDPANVDPAKADPTKADPTKADPAKADPTKADPAKADPTKADPTKADPAKADPTKADPAKADPTKADPTKADPANVDSAKAAPANVQPASAEPVNVQPTNNNFKNSELSKEELPKVAFIEVKDNKYIVGYETKENGVYSIDKKECEKLGFFKGFFEKAKLVANRKEYGIDFMSAIRADVNIFRNLNDKDKEKYLSYIAGQTAGCFDITYENLDSRYAKGLTKGQEKLALKAAEKLEKYGPNTAGYIVDVESAILPEVDEKNHNEKQSKYDKLFGTGFDQTSNPPKAKSKKAKSNNKTKNTKQTQQSSDAR